MTRSTAVETQIERWVSRLEHAFGRLLRCDTWIEQPHRHNRKGNTFRVRVEITVPGTTLVVSRDTADRDHENVYAAISDAFRAARRQLLAHADAKQAASFAQ